MKTIVEINGINYGSTGKIALNIAKEARKRGYEVFTFCRKSKQGLKFKYPNQIYIGFWIDRVISERLAYYTGLNGGFNYINTLLFLHKLNKIKPDLVHIHNLCDNYINNRLFFTYLKFKNIPVVWTLHDSWAFTGRCGVLSCDGWKTGCNKCQDIQAFPPAKIDITKYTWKIKKEAFTSLNNMVLVSPSFFLKDLIQESFFKKKYPINVINNGIDFSIFKPCNGDFRSKYSLQDKFVILGVSFGWSESKGLFEFIELSKKLGDSFQIILVGTNETTDLILPKNIISIHKTYDQLELAQIYSSSDLFVNPTKNDNFPTVNIESLACGTPVLTYDTGGSKEIIDETCGSFVPTNDIDGLVKEIIRIAKEKPYTKENCLRRASKFNMNDKFNEYVELFNSILN